MFWKKNSVEFFAFADGESIPLEQVKDQVFSSGMMGAGMAIVPSGDYLIAPSDALVIAANERMQYTIGLSLSNGVEILFHIGIDTVTLQNEGFKLLVKQGQKVKKGQQLIHFDRENIRKSGLDGASIVIFTDMKDKTIKFEPYGKVKANESLLLKIE